MRDAPVYSPGVARSPLPIAAVLLALRAGLTRCERPVLTAVGLLVAAIFLTDRLSGV